MINISVRRSFWGYLLSDQSCHYSVNTTHQTSAEINLIILAKIISQTSLFIELEYLLQLLEIMPSCFWHLVLFKA